MGARLGRRYSDVVSLSRPRSSESGRIDCTVPLPNVRLPTTLARPASCRQAATISAALAVSPSTRTTAGTPGSFEPADARLASRVVALSVSLDRRPRVCTITPSSRKRSQTSTAAVSSPPGLPRRSITRPRTSFVAAISSTAAESSDAVRSPKDAIRTKPTPGTPSIIQSQPPAGVRRSPRTLCVSIISRTSVTSRRSAS